MKYFYDVLIVLILVLSVVSYATSSFNLALIDLVIFIVACTFESWYNKP